MYGSMDLRAKVRPDEATIKESVRMTIKEWKSEVVTIQVDYETCAGHGDCVDVCPSSVYELKDGKTVPVRIGECIECCSCVAACPVHAIQHSSCG
jgi:NAD-dependent dihydropyrimidine dehydrogenase PreA subunit